MVAEACTSKFCCDSSLGCFFSSCGLYGGNTCLSRLLGDAGWLDTYPVGVASSLSCGTVDFVCHGQSLPQQDPGSHSHDHQNLACTSCTQTDTPDGMRESSFGMWNEWLELQTMPGSTLLLRRCIRAYPRAPRLPCPPLHLRINLRALSAAICR